MLQPCSNMLLLVLHACKDTLCDGSDSLECAAYEWEFHPTSCFELTLLLSLLWYVPQDG